MPMKFRCSTCGKEDLCEDCAWEAYSGGVPQGLINISSGEDACSKKEGKSYPVVVVNNGSLQLRHGKEKKSQEGSIVIVKPTLNNEILHEE